MFSSIASGSRAGTNRPTSDPAASGRPAALTRSDPPIRLNLSRQELEQAWVELAELSAAQSYRTSWRMALGADESVAFLREKMTATASTDRAVMERLIADLDSGRFATRRKAENELKILERLAEPALARALDYSSSLEQRRRIEGLIAKFDPIRSRERLRVLRAVAVLEEIGTPAARQLLQKLAAGASRSAVDDRKRESLSSGCEGSKTILTLLVRMSQGGEAEGAGRIAPFSQGDAACPSG